MSEKLTIADFDRAFRALEDAPPLTYLKIHPQHFKTPEGREFLKRLLREESGCITICGKQLSEADIDAYGRETNPA